MKHLLRRRADNSREILARLDEEARQDTVSVDRIAQHLTNANVEVRSKAARLVGELGDPAAIPHLQEALRRCYLRRSFGLHVFAGWLGIAVVVVVCVVLFLTFCILSKSAPTSGYREFGEWFVDLRRGQDPFVRDCIAAIERIAEQDATPASRAIVPFLKGIAVDPLHHSAETRATARFAVQRIEAQTAEIKQMPLAACAPNLRPEALPIPAGDTRRVRSIS